MIAIREIERGELILSEAPLLQLPPIPADMIHPSHFLTAGQRHSAAITVATAINAMPREQRAGLNELHGQQNNKFSIVGTNAFTHPSHNVNGIEMAVASVYKDISRANHSGRPNAMVIWNEREQRGNLHALQPIRDKTEITVDYLSDHSSCLRDGVTRNAQLQQHYGFTCRCPACNNNNGAPNGADDHQRNNAFLVYGQIDWDIDTEPEARDVSDDAELHRREQIALLDQYTDALKQLGLTDWKLAEAYRARAKQHELGFYLCSEGVDVPVAQGNVPELNDHAVRASEDWRRALWTGTRCYGLGHEEVETDTKRMLKMQIMVARLPSPTIAQGFP